MVAGGFDCGIAFDGDADRCLACDEKGREMDGDKIIALLAMTMKEKDRLDGDTAVVTVMSNLGFIKYMESQGIHTEKTAVGDRYVLENMRENGYAIGGEQSGHVILLHHATTGDGELTAGKLLKLLAESGKKMSELNGIYEQYPQVLVNVTANAAQKAAYKEDEVLAGFIENEQQKLPSFLYAMIVFKLTFSTLLKILDSTYGLISFIFAINCFVSILLDFVTPSGLHVVQVSVNLHAHWIKCNPL